MADKMIYMDDSVNPKDFIGSPAGFADQRLVVVPRPVIVEALDRPLTRRMVVTDAGYFPRAAGHGRNRRRGAGGTVVIVCVAGSGWIETGGMRTEVGPAHVVVLPGGTGVPHSYGASEADPWTIWWCHLRGTDVPELLEVAGVKAPGSVVPLASVDRLAASLDEIVSTLENDQGPTGLIESSGAAWRLLTQLATDRRIPAPDEPMERALTYLRSRIEGTVRVPDLAAMLGVSTTRLGRLFRDSTGGGVVAHHLVLKMAHARHLLDTTELSIAEVGRRVGMTDQFYFSRQFSRTHGMSPTSYRAERKG
ncbi:helix-turn-helix domain-containing protein [Paenarthrobacter sp. NPDC091711]|uniref:AraC family transcriptional regulator n=1 Tax=Micrococcaceae TaxID=1268 RepID=UPI00089D1722|nr:AraC family transcriptional regulator [Arthrobacter sp. cf158]SDX50755.1 AraC-type DNA-binding protein [Arthrobacter sp. cf158]